MMSYRIDSVMRSPVKSLPVETLAIDALQFAEDNHVHHLPLVERGKVVGVVCTCDLEELELKAPVRSGMRRPAAVIAAEADVSEAVQTMSERSIGSLLVTNDDEVVGIVTREDLAEAGVDVASVPHFRCRSCGSVSHLKREGEKGTLCIDCRARAQPETPGDGTGVGD